MLEATAEHFDKFELQPGGDHDALRSDRRWNFEGPRPRGLRRVTAESWGSKSTEGLWRLPESEKPNPPKRRSPPSIPMKLPKLSPEPTRLFERLVAGDERLRVRKVFGNPTAFANGNMCFGVFGSDVFLRLNEGDQELAMSIPGVRPFEPMAGRPMRGYLILPPAVLSDARRARRWVEAAVKHTLGLPPKGPKTRAPGARRRT
jgi:hypothetical protein